MNLILLLSLLSTVASARIPAALNPYPLIEEEKARAFLTKSPKCNLAIGIKYPGGKIAAKVYCIADTTVGEGTINPRKGCTVMLYDPNTDRYHSTALGPSDEELGMVRAGKPCADGGWGELLEMVGAIECHDRKTGDPMGPIVGHMITFGHMLDTPGPKESNTVLLYSNAPNYEKTWRAWREAAKPRKPICED
jgi:hypothetical protein